MQEHHRTGGVARGYVSLLTVGLSAFGVSPAFAQEPTSEPAAIAEETEEITVTGFRAALRERSTSSASPA